MFDYWVIGIISGAACAILSTIVAHDTSSICNPRSFENSYQGKGFFSEKGLNLIVAGVRKPDVIFSMMGIARFRI